MKCLKISPEINDNKKGRAESSSFKTLTEWQNKDNGSKLLKIRSKGDRILLAGKFSEDYHILKEQHKPSKEESYNIEKEKY